MRNFNYYNPFARSTNVKVELTVKQKEDRSKRKARAILNVKRASEAAVNGMISVVGIAVVTAISITIVKETINVNS